MTDTNRFGGLVKELYIKEIKKSVETAPFLFVTRFKGLSSNGLNDLRKRLRNSEATYRVFKNSLLRRVFKGSHFESMIPSVEGQCGIGLTRGDAARVSKVLSEFSDENPTLVIEKAYLDGKIFGLKEIKEIAKLPSRPELLAKIVGTLISPVQGLVGVLSGVMRNFVNTLDQIKKKKEQGS